MSSETRIDSHAVYKAVWDAKLKPAGLKLIALAYAKHADPDGSSIRPGRAKIMELTGYAKDFVRDSTNHLIQIGVLRVVREATQTTPRHYCMDLAVLTALAVAGTRVPARRASGGREPTRGARADEGSAQRGWGARRNEGGGLGATRVGGSRPPNLPGTSPDQPGPPPGGGGLARRAAAAAAKHPLPAIGEAKHWLWLAQMREDLTGRHWDAIAKRAELYVDDLPALTRAIEMLVNDGGLRLLPGPTELAKSRDSGAKPKRSRIHVRGENWQGGLHGHKG